MKQETRNKRIGKDYQTANFTMTALGKKQNPPISRERIKQILLETIGEAEIKNVKMIRKMKVVERFKKNYLKNV